MYTVTVRDAFIAQYYLTVPDAGPEGEAHSREYEVELAFCGAQLNDSGYLLDIDAAKAALEDVKKRYTDRLVNDLPEFENTNPSVERFCREIADRVADRMDSTETLETLRVTLHEDETAAAAYERSIA